jgi:integrase
MSPRKKGRANGEGSVYETPKGSGRWMAQLTLPSGRKERRRAASQREGLEILARLRKELLQGVDLSLEQPTVAQWCTIWLAKFAKQLKPNIRDDYAGIVRREIESAPIGRVRLDRLTVAQVQDWIDAMSDEHAPRTVRNAHARLRTALKVAVKRGYRATNPAEAVDLPPERAYQIITLNFAQAARLLDQLRGHRWAALYRLALTTGMRQGEILGLTWDMVDLKEGLLHVRQQLRRVRRAGEEKAREFVLQTTKTAAGDRVIHLDDTLITVLQAHRANQVEEQTFTLQRGRRWHDPFLKRGGLLFVADSGAPVHATDLRNHLLSVLAAAGLPTVRFHDLRHTAATLMLADNVPIVTVSKILGHSSPAVTAKIYAHALDSAKATAIAGLSRRLGGVS